MKRLIPLAVVAAWSATAHANPFVPGEPQQTPIALVGGTVYQVSGPPIPGGVVLFDQGEIVGVGKVGNDVELPEGTVSIDVSGKRVYPGLFDAYTQMGLSEIGMVRATRDESETGKINPNARALVAVNPDSETIPVARANGVLSVLTVPSGGLISGLGAVMRLDGWTYEDMGVRRDAAMIVNWPRTVPVRSFWSREQVNARLDRRDDDIRAIRQAFADARAYAKAKAAAESSGAEPPKFDSRWEAMLPVLEGRTPVMIHADELTQIQAAVAFAASEKIRLIICGGYDAPECAELLKKHDTPVVVAGVHRLPQRRHDDYDAAFTLPARLRQAGVQFCVSGAERLGNTRNLPYHAATAAAYGLSPEDALKSITLWPADVLGVADRLGSLARGKEATLLVTDGDILEVPTQVEMAFIEGRRVDLNDKQKLLWEKYKEKYRRLEGGEQRASRVESPGSRAESGEPGS